METENTLYEELKDLESWLQKQPADCFQRVDPTQGRNLSPKQYEEIKEKLLPIHDKVEKGALLASVASWRQKLILKIEKLKNTDDELNKEEMKLLYDLLEHDPAIYLNQHGIGHVNKVIEKVSEIITSFRNENDIPTPFEIFILLCAIQLHDLGNIFGRDDHEKSFQQEFNKIAQSIIPDNALRTYIYRIARVHSGNIDEDYDTLSDKSLGGHYTMIYNQNVRVPLLAALLRFGDELADDASRADPVGMDMKIIPEQSIIYHKYSCSLHSVKINENGVDKTLFLSLDYYIDAESISEKYIKNGKEILLIDEIFNRTKKIERERRYCMRFLGQYLPLLEIRVKIEIVPSFDMASSEKITYTLKEKGYPLNEISIDCPNNTGDKVIETLKKKGWDIK